ncbi:uncharacterized protein LOC135161604 isoform X2 [Diachasmimorpha longicaudata]|uniref:uncharacterized protein LOC135161604 isoform X2 n=1 Tax=Diachasmimorpha longicaudata TaxID=58733 RepID=UPI0030B87C76
MSANSKLSEYVEFRRITRALLFPTGLWLSGNTGSLYSYLPLISMIVSSITGFGILMFTTHHITRVTVVVRGMSIGTSFLSVILKIICIISQRERGTRVHQILDNYCSAALRDERMSKIMLNGITSVRRICFIVVFTVGFGVVMFILTPTMSIINQKRNGVQPVKCSLMYPGLYPWDNSENGIVCQIHFVIELLASLRQLRIMSHRLTSFSEKENIEIVIRECLQQYKVLLRCRDSIEDIFGPLVVWMMGTNAVVLCALMFQLSQMTSISIVRGIAIINYLVMKTVQTYIYTWSGTVLITESQKYHETVYNINWLGSKPIMSSIIIMLSQRPIHLKPFGFSVISVNIFIMVGALNERLQNSYLFLSLSADSQNNCLLLWFAQCHERKIQVNVSIIFEVQNCVPFR